MYEQVDYAKAFSDFRKLIAITKPCKEKLSAATPIKISNAYRVRGEEFKGRRTVSKGEEGRAKQLKEAHHEKHLHQAIVKHPFLLHTPELYAGGLYLETLINKFSLHKGHITDFLYVTVQDCTIRVTLVEIEQAAWRIFDKDALGKVTFHAETKKPFSQVADWQKELSSSFGREALLWKLQSIFKGYPYPIFSQGKNSKLSVRLDIGYVLIMGNELPKSQEQQQLIDQMYLDNNILFMTYPMMLAESERHVSARNVISVGTYGPTVKSACNPDALHPVFSFPGGDSFDPHGIKRYGLGHPNASHPSSIAQPRQLKKAFYRSQGLCEKDGCVASLFEAGEFVGDVVWIFNQISSDYNTRKRQKPSDDLDHCALACPLHSGMLSFNDGQWRYLGEPHPQKSQMSYRRAYRADLDTASQNFVRRRVKNISSDIVEALEIDQLNEPDLADQIHRCALALRSLPFYSKILIREILKDHYKSRCASRVDRSVEIAGKSLAWFFLRTFGLVECNPSAERYRQMEPTIFSKSLIDRIDLLFSSREFFAFAELCNASADGLRRELKRARDESVKDSC
ncbi:Shedu anti-phage system protein SduA domain-containing protein [Pseudomonas retamae]|uniref:Shedu anti-phage system protein SduA domain-containing protein n=1 Tax=Pseudomonas retamae TaxID=702110 RepID=A0ABW7DBH7_9PSED